MVISKWKKRENEPHMSHKQIKRSCGGLSEKSVRKKKWWTGELNPGPCGGAAFQGKEKFGWTEDRTRGLFGRWCRESNPGPFG